MSPKSIRIRPFEAKVLFVNQQFGNVHSKHHNPICVRQNEQSEIFICWQYTIMYCHTF